MPGCRSSKRVERPGGSFYPFPHAARRAPTRATVALCGQQLTVGTCAAVHKPTRVSSVGPPPARRPHRRASVEMLRYRALRAHLHRRPLPPGDPGACPDPPGARSCPIRNATAVAPRNSSSTSGLPTGDNRADTVPRNKRHELILGFGPGQPMWGYRIQGKLLLQTARKRRVIGARASFSPSKRFGDPGCSQRHGGTALLYVARYSARPR